jgi:hypothetical protein
MPHLKLMPMHVLCALTFGSYGWYSSSSFPTEMGLIAPAHTLSLHTTNCRDCGGGGAELHPEHAGLPAAGLAWACAAGEDE